MRLLNTRLTYFSPVFHFYNPWERQKTKGFWRFQGLEKVNIGLKWVNMMIVVPNVFKVNDKNTSYFIDNLKYVFAKWDSILTPLLPSWKLSIVNVMTVEIVTLEL